jgi:enamine deaminase RidA (YjgF/YER057c/UK114 family)
MYAGGQPEIGYFEIKTINMTKINLLFLAAIFIAPLSLLAQSAPTLPTGTSAEVWAGNTLYVSGSLDPDIKSHPTTELQTVGLIKDLKKRLESQGLTLGNVVMMHVYLGGDPAKDGKMDFEGMMAGYTQFFGTRDQPNKPARTTVQVVLPAGARGALIEIDLIAVRP